MGKNNAIFITLENYKKDYYDCIKCIDKILKTNLYFDFRKRFNIKIMKYSGNTIAPNKLEEPLRNNDISTSVTEVIQTTDETFDNIHFHLRIHLNNEDGDTLSNLHYLALLIEYYRELVDQKRLSVFIIPDTGVNQYPFYSNETKDGISETYRMLSSYLRAIIKGSSEGVIFSVKKPKDDKEENVIEALNIHEKKVSTNVAPLMVFRATVPSYDDIHQNTVEETIKTYLVSKKRPDVEGEIHKTALDNFRLIFRNGVLDDYIARIIEISALRSRYRFGFSNDTNASIALADYVFEMAFRSLKNKFDEAGVDIHAFQHELQLYLGTLSIFAFTVFSCIFYAESCEDIVNNIKRFSITAKEITDGVYQLIQNSLQHSSRHICAVSLNVQSDEKQADRLIIKVSDLSDLDIFDTFFVNIEKERNEIANRIIKSDNEFFNICDLKDTYKTIVDLYEQLLQSKNTIDYRMMFNEFDRHNPEANTLWKKFREIDSSAHIGLALFSQTVHKYGGAFSVVLKNDHMGEYVDLEESNDIFIGTDYIITLPINIYYNLSPSSLNKISFNNSITENYQSYARFLNYDMEDDLKKYVKSQNVRSILEKHQKLNLNNALEKFLNQFTWTRFWLTVFVEFKGTNKAYCFNMEEIFGEALSDSTIDEMMIKGLINAVDVYASYLNKSQFESDTDNTQEILFAFTHISDVFYDMLRNITASLAIKDFPQTLQMFFVCPDKSGNSYHYTHLLGSTYGEAACNSFNLSIENGSRSYSNEQYATVMRLMAPFYDIEESGEPSDIIEKHVFPFTSFIREETNLNLFFNDLKRYAENNMLNGSGYKLTHSHTKLGNKVHIDAFYEMSFAFYRTIVANRIAFEILRNMMKLGKSSGLNILESPNILFLGYASYSEAIMISVTDILNCYRETHGIMNNKAEYALFQYNLRTESQSEIIEIQMSSASNDCVTSSENDKSQKKLVNVIQIVPISSTMTTFQKVWDRFYSTYKDSPDAEYHLKYNFTVFWTKPSENSEIDTDSYYRIENPSENYVMCEKLTSLSQQAACRVTYIISGTAKWEDPEKCMMCYPDNVLDEVPLIETDPTSTVPSQQIKLIDNCRNACTVDEKNIERIKMLKGYINYGHYVRGSNHFQFYVETQKFFSRYSEEIKKWLLQIREADREGKNRFPHLNIIFSPEHNTNVGFSQYVNSHYFNGNAEIVSINEDKEFRSNFICEYADLKKTIKHMWDNYSNQYDIHTPDQEKPVRFFFVDDSINSGSTFYKSNSFLQSLIPSEYRAEYSEIIYEKCFVIVDRLSKESKKSYIASPDGYYAFCHFDISNMRKQGDSCTCCKFRDDAVTLFRKSATNSLADYWKGKCRKTAEQSFDTIPYNKEHKELSYLRLVLSHIAKNLLNSHSAEEKHNVILMLFDFFESKISKRSVSRAYEDLDTLELYWEGLIKDYSDFENNSRLLDSLIKILSRPFFIYDQDEKQAILRLLVAISECMINPDYKKLSQNDVMWEITDNIVQCLKKDKRVVNFMQETLFEAFADLRSTYLIRQITIDKIRAFASRWENCEFSWVPYLAAVQRIIQGSNDETRTVRLENTILCNRDNYDESYYSDEIGKAFSDRMNESFYSELFLLNGYLYYDSIKYYCEKKSKTESSVEFQDNNVYYDNRLERIRSMDSRCLPACTYREIAGFEDSEERALYELLHNDRKRAQKSGGKAITGERSRKNNSIKSRYKRLLDCLGKMITSKYQLKNDEIKSVILTIFEKEEDTIITGSFEPDRKPKYSMNDLQIIEMSSQVHNSTTTRFKYITKEKVLKKIDGTDLRKGYVVEDDDSSSRFFIINFDNMIDINDEAELRIGRGIRKICPVYLYFEITSPNANKALLWFILRDIMAFRDSILNYLEYDFTSDVLSEYATLILKEAIFNAERALSHTSMISDRKELESLVSVSNEAFNRKYNKDYIDADGMPKKLEYKVFTKEKALEWAYAKNFTNTTIAKLYNHMMIDINKSLPEILRHKMTSPLSPILYVQEGYRDGINNSANTVSELIPYSDKGNDCIYALCREIVDFDCTGVPQDAKVYSRAYDDNMITYNASYIRSIIYRIIFDAIYNSPDINGDGFIDCIEAHYRNINNRLSLDYKLVDSKIRDMVRKLGLYKKCCVKFYVEDSTQSDFNWLVIENTLNTNVRFKMDEIYKKLRDPIDYNDGHISVIASNEYLCKLHGDESFAVEKMYYVSETEDRKVFVTKLPIIKKGELI